MEWGAHDSVAPNKTLWRRPCVCGNNSHHFNSYKYITIYPRYRYRRAVNISVTGHTKQYIHLLNKKCLVAYKIIIQWALSGLRYHRYIRFIGPALLLCGRSGTSGPVLGPGPGGQSWESELRSRPGREGAVAAELAADTNNDDTELTGTSATDQ